MHLLRKSGIGLQGGGDGLIQIVERSYLGPKKSLLLVQAGEWTLMLGVTDDSITRLAQWRTGKAELEKRRESAHPFAGYLKSLKEQVPGMPFGEQRGEG
jgi:flagellar biogenesis protein FliO